MPQGFVEGLDVRRLFDASMVALPLNCGALRDHQPRPKAWSGLISEAALEQKGGQVAEGASLLLAPLGQRLKNLCGQRDGDAL